MIMSSSINSAGGDDDDHHHHHPNKPPHQHHHHGLYTKLAAITNSSAVNKTSILVDATRYIEDLKRKVDHHLITDQDQTTAPASASASASSSSSHPPLSDMVKVETLETGGFLINVLLEQNVPGLLVSVLEAFEHLGLDLLDARVSNSPHNFHLHAIATHSDGGINAQLVKQAVVQAIFDWVDTSYDDKDED